MPSDIFIERDGHRTWLKWHRARRRGTDAVFTATRILEGMREGASVEVDLVIHGDDGMAVLHDLSLERETTGSGLVRNTGAEVLRGLNLRDNAGAVLPDRVMLLEDLGGLLARDGAHADALLQLDYKEDAAALDDAVIASFANALGPVAGQFILSAGDAEAVRMLSDGVPGLRIGYDPCHGQTLERLRKSGDFAGFVAETVGDSPKAELVYIAYPVVLAADDAGFDLIGAFHAAERRVDAYTINRADDAGVAVAERLVALRVDQITTDDPEGLGRALER